MLICIKRAGGNHSAPTVTADGLVLVGDSAGELLALTPEGKRRWVHPLTDGYVRSSPVPMTHHRVVVGTMTGLYVLGGAR
jgi:outer membrane protein assembly factor BamB